MIQNHMNDQENINSSDENKETLEIALDFCRKQYETAFSMVRVADIKDYLNNIYTDIPVQILRD